MSDKLIHMKLGDVAYFGRGLTFAKGDVTTTSSKKVLRSNNIDLETLSLNFDDVAYLNDDFTIPNDKMLRKGDIFICMSNGSTQHLGKVAYIDSDIDYAFGGFMGAIRPNTTKVFPKYIYYVCRSSEYKRFLASIFNGININNLKWSDLSNLKIPVPALAEQERIVGELDLLSGIIDRQKAQLRELDSLAKSIFYDMFGDPITNEKGWEVKQLQEVSTLLNGRAYKQDELLADGKYKVLRVGNFFTNGEYYYSDLELDDDKYCDTGDLLFAWSASFGAFIWNGGKVIYHYHIWKVLFDKDKLDIQYYRYLLNAMTSYFMKDVHGMAMFHLTKVGMEQYQLPIPPLSMQKSFAEKIDNVEKQKELIKQSISDTEALFHSRMDYYFD